MAEDKNLMCRDCMKTFVFTAGEQAFFEEKGLSAPIRCPDCRRMRKQQRSMDAPAAPRDAGPPRSPSGPPRTGGDGRPGGGYDRGPSATRTADAPPRAPRTGMDDESETRNFRKSRPPASVAAKFSPPKKEQAAVPKEKRPNNRRDEEKLLLNWKEEAGLDDLDSDSDWLPMGEEDEE